MSCNKQYSDVVERFMRYVQIASTSDPHNDQVVPSTQEQFDMAKLLVDELESVGCVDIVLDEHAYVTATFPASKGYENLPALALCAHIDTSPDAPGTGVKPHIVHYTGGKLVSGVVDGVEVATSPEDCPYLAQWKNCDIIVSDGTTLLSGDDKAGIAEIVSLLHRLQNDASIVHPCIKIAFVPDEEIGHGAELLDLDAFGAEYGYTVDGGDISEFSYECFNACEATVHVKGVMIHPGSAKDIMVNAITVLREFDSMLPAFDRPEHTEGYEGFFHPTEIKGTASEATLSYIIRDHSSSMFAKRQEMMQEVARYLNLLHGDGTVTVTFKQEYRNMAEKFEGREFLVDFALAAYREAGIEPQVLPIRGGTDGAQLTFRGLACPNIATGGAQAHSIKEFVPVKAMETVVDILQNLVVLFAKQKG